MRLEHHKITVVALAAAALSSGYARAGQGPPLAFVANHGQWDDATRFVARRGPMTAAVGRDGIEVHQGQLRLGLHFVDASPGVEVVGLERLPARTNYFVGPRSDWHADVPSFGAVLLHGLYEGVDVRLGERDAVLKYDVMAGSAAQLERVVIRCDGVERLEVSSNGSLVMHTAAGAVLQPPPVSWQVSQGGERVPVTCEYCLVDATSYAFQVSGRVADLPLVIDPWLDWASLLGGDGRDVAKAVAADAAGNLYVVGSTASTDFPTTTGAYDETGPDSSQAAYVSKLSPDGSTLLWSTYLGGIGVLEGALDVAVSPEGVVTIVGRTPSFDFPTTDGAYAQMIGGSDDAFVTRLDPSQSGLDQLVWSTFLGGSLSDRAGAVHVADDGVVTVAGYTQSADFPTTQGTVSPDYNGGFADAWVARLDPSGSQLVWSTFLGGSNEEGCCEDTIFLFNWDLIDVEVTDAGETYVCGYTSSADFMTTPDAFDETGNGLSDGFVSHLSADAATLLWSTVVGDIGEDWLQTVKVDEAGIVTASGATESVSFPVTAGAFDTTLNNAAAVQDGALVRFDPRLSGAAQMLYGTFIGGSGHDGISDMELVGDGGVFVAGYARSGFPTTPDALDGSYNGGDDLFVARLSVSGQGLADLLYSTFFGASGNEWVNGMTVQGWDLIVTGPTSSPTFPATTGAYDITLNNEPGVFDTYVARFDLCPFDLNDDGVIDTVDFLAVLAAWGACPGECQSCDADFNGDCQVDTIDFLTLLAKWGPCQ